jgi:tRNA pseudouridine synthase 10
MDILQTAETLLARHNLCDSCLGRQFARLGRGIENSERGRVLRALLQLSTADREIKRQEIEASLASGDFQKLSSYTNAKRSEVSECFLCEGVIPRAGEYVEVALSTLKSSPYEYETFLLGCRVPGRILEREDNLRAELRLELGESLKNEISRLIGKNLQTQLAKPVAFLNPDLVILLDLQRKEATVEAQPIFIYGRYRKLVRGIPQSIWLCNNCRGVGCEECQNTGRRYSTSIEELLSKPMVELAEGAASKFHAAGREDVDARTLGTGRPFVVEVKQPRHRMLDLNVLREKVNAFGEGKVEVDALSVSSRHVLRQLKMGSTQATKVYHALVEMEDALSEEQLKTLEASFVNTLIHQRTPTRVLHRRADRVRARKIYSVKLSATEDPKRFDLVAETQGGLYVKEFISGDEGRTRPSLSEVLGKPIRCIELDVMSVEGRKEDGQEFEGLQKPNS